ncbi:MAG: DNA-binding protein WhiA [Oscillospiraceae bacterium]|nr:DNA-binding protein WhiA [Oscillospiraceae bacterium]
MSFSSSVKEEICRELTNRKCCSVAECYGILLYCNTFSSKEIRIITESREFAGVLPRLFRRAFGITFDVLPDISEQRGKVTFVISDPAKLARIFDTYGYGGSSLVAHHINLSVLEEDCCRVSFIKGAFLAGGSVTDPMKRYHLELVTDHYNVSREIFPMLLDMGFEPKSTSRGGNYIVYFKQSEAIADMLTTLGAPVSAMNVMSAKIEKEMTNSVNRKVNCDTANVLKSVDAAQRQLEAIRKIGQNSGIESLPERLRETALLRMENPEYSMSELAAAHAPPITKSCLNHRIRKIIEIAESIG